MPRRALRIGVGRIEEELLRERPSTPGERLAQPAEPAALSASSSCSAGGASSPRKPRPSSASRRQSFDRFLAEPLGDDLGDAVGAHRDAVEDVSGLDGSLLVRDDDELCAVGERPQKIDEAADIASSSAASTSSSK